MPKNISIVSFNLDVNQKIYIVSKFPLYRDVEMGNNTKWEVRSTDSAGQGLFCQQASTLFKELFLKTILAKEKERCLYIYPLQRCRNGE